MDGIDADKIDADLSDSGQPFQDLLFSQMPEVELDVFAQGVLESPPLVDLGLDAPGNDVAGRQLHGRRRVALHETLPLVVDQIGALAPAPFRHEDVRADQAGGVELDKLHVLERDTRRVGHSDAAAAVDQGVGGVLVYPPVTAGAEKRRPGAHGDEFARAHIQDDNAVAPAFVDAQGGDEPFRVDFYPFGDGPFIEGVEQYVAGDIGGIAGPGIAGAAEGTLGDRAVGEPAERAAPVLHLIDDRRGLAAHDLRGILIGQIIAPLDRVEGVLLPGVVPAVGVVGERRVDAALGGDGVGTGRVDLGDKPHIETVAKPDGSPKTRETAADNENIVLNHSYEALT